MATYKLIQDIEAEDHILGPLSLRQFIFALVAVFCWYLTFIFFAKHVYFLLVITVPPGLFCTFFAIPFGRDQPTEIWALAKLRFWFKPRRRIWDQSGVKELVTITVPKKVERVLTKGFSQNEVQSRLKALANTLDTRGWAVKNIDAGTYVPGNIYGQPSSDRLIDIGTAAPEVPSYDVQASDDILDVTSNPVAQQFQAMINQSNLQHRQHIMEEMNATGNSPGQTGASGQRTGGANWFMNPPVTTTTASAATMPVSTPQLAQQMPQQTQAPAAPVLSQPQLKQPLAYSHMRTLQPMGQQAAASQSAAQAAQNAQQQQPQPATSGAAASDPAILSLANNNDLNVSTIARQAHKAAHGEEPPQGEVVVSLH